MAISTSREEIRNGEDAPELRAVRSTFRAAVVTLIPEAAELDAAGWRELESIVGRSLAERPPALRRRLRLFLRALRWLPVPRYGRTFEALGHEHRRHVLGYLQDHRLRIVRVGFWGLRTLALMGYYGRANAARAIGYRAHPRGWQAHGRE